MVKGAGRVHFLIGVWINFVKNKKIFNIKKKIILSLKETQNLLLKTFNQDKLKAVHL